MKKGRGAVGTPVFSWYNILRYILLSLKGGAKHAKYKVSYKKS